jgi:DNA-binding NtrC family response regulator
MNQKYTIVVADKNSHVRELIKRELNKERYRVRSVKNCKEIFDLENDFSPIDLLIIDPDLPDIDGADLFRKLKNKAPQLPIVIHTYLSDNMIWVPSMFGVDYVEKNAGSIDHLKRIVKTRLIFKERSRTN